MTYILEHHTCGTYIRSTVVEFMSVLNTGRTQLVLSTVNTDDISLFLYGVHSVK